MLDNINVFFLDGIVEKDSMITEVLYWDKEAAVFKNATASDSKYPVTLRKGTVPSTDINSDGILEIPFAKQSIGKPYMNLTDWKQFGFKGFNSVLSGVCTDELIFNFPDKWNGNIAVIQKGNVWTFYDINSDNNEVLFSLLASGISDRQQYSDEYDKLKIDYGTIYGVKITSSKSKLALTKNEIADCIVNIR